MGLRKGHEKELMLSLFTKEASYGAGVAVSSANFVLMNGYTSEPAPENVVTNNKGEHTGSEVNVGPLDITEKRVKFPYTEPRVSPNGLAGIAALAFGDLTSTLDFGASYTHYIKGLAVGSDLASIGMVYDPANDQDTYVGVKAGNFKLSSEEGGYINMETELITSGKLTGSAETFESSITEVKLKARDTKIYVKTAPNPATDIIAPANFSQDSDNISSAQSLTSIGEDVISWNVEMNNNPVEIPGHGGLGYLQDIDFGRRSYALTMTLRYTDDTWKTRFDNKTAMALEFNCKDINGGLIDAGGANYYGMIARVPLAYLMTRPEPKGGPDDFYTIELTFEISDDGTNPFMDIMVYNAQAAYLA